MYHIIEEETKHKNKGERMCRTSKIQPQIKTKFTYCTIMSSHRFLCNTYIELQMQTENCDWIRRQFHYLQVEVV